MVHTAEPSVSLAFAPTLVLAFMVVVSRSIDKDVHWPPHQLLADNMKSRGDWRLLSELMDFMCKFAQFGGILSPRRGIPRHITLNVAGSFMMLSMRHLPRKVRHEKR